MNNTKENTKQAWLNLVKKHRKKQKGLPALSTLNTDAGNVEYNISVFNSMSNTGSCDSCGMGESVTTDEWQIIKTDRWYEVDNFKPKSSDEIICTGTEKKCKDNFAQLIMTAQTRAAEERDAAKRHNTLPVMKIARLDKYSLILQYPYAKSRVLYILTPVSSSSINEELLTPKNSVELYYEDLYVTIYSNRRSFYDSPDEYTETPIKTDYVYRVHIKDVVGALEDIVVDKEEFPEGISQSFEDTDAWTEYVHNYVVKNFDMLVEKYYKDVLEYFRDDAESEAEDYMNDSSYEDFYEDLDDHFDMSTRSIL